MQIVGFPMRRLNYSILSLLSELISLHGIMVKPLGHVALYKAIAVEWNVKQKTSTACENTIKMKLYD